MDRLEYDFDPYDFDPTRWAHSMAHLGEIVIPCLDAVGARSVAEVGAFAGDLTRLLVHWAADRDATVLAIDPDPEPRLLELEKERPELELMRQTSIEALPRIPVPDVMILDGDHNYWTVSEELRLIYERAPGSELPLVLLHDVCWPHGRRDDYFDAAQIPEGYRHPVAGEGDQGLFPGEPGLRSGGLPYPRSAREEGGPRNGVRTAVEDFAASRDGLRFAVVPSFFGFGALWHTDAPWADAVGELLRPWDANPLLERLEENRVHHLATAAVRQSEIWRLQERLARQEAVLSRLLESSAFAVAERLSGIRERAGVAPEQSVISREEIRRALR